MRRLTLLLLLVCLSPYLAAQETRSSSGSASAGADFGPISPAFFGLHINHPRSPWPPFPFGSYRFWDDGTRWQLIEPSPDKWDWTDVDYWTGQISSRGITDATYILGGPPPWAVNLQGDENCDYANPAKLRTPGQGICRPPKDLNSDGSGPNLIWRKAVITIAGHFKKSPVHVSSWEVWQEFVRRGGENLTASWLGTNEQMVRLAQDARCLITGRGRVRATNENCGQVLKTVGLTEPIDPTSVIIGPTAGIGMKAWDQRFEEYWETPGAAEAADVVGLHLYPRWPEEMFDRFQAWHATLPREVAAKPVWLTEGGWHRGSIVDPDMQAAFVARFQLLARGLGIGRIYWYSYDTPTMGELMGTKAGDGYKRIHEWMVGNTITGCSKEGSVYRCGLTKADGTPMLAVWDASQTCSDGRCSTSNFKAPSKYTAYFTLDDTGSAPIRAGTVAIGAKPILLSGR
jgi:hypothetical protein